MAAEAHQPPPDVDAETAAKAANRFDIRRIIGGLFLVYGAILVVIGLAGSEAVKTKAAGVNVNLWTGLGMLVFGALMVAWALSRPTAPDAPDD
jgi:ABC-type transport system involved in multi-copper enzyme maturation permease subunit